MSASRQPLHASLPRTKTTSWLAIALTISIAGCAAPEDGRLDDMPMDRLGSPLKSLGSKTSSSVSLTPQQELLAEHQLDAPADADVMAKGDFDGDGAPDYAVGEWDYADGSAWNGGRVKVFPTTGCGAVPDAVPTLELRPGADGLPGNAVVDGRFGFALAVADFDADGYDDLAIGMPGPAGSSNTFPGAAYVVYGSDTGLTTAGAMRLDQASPTMWGSAEGGDGFGHALAAADFDGDGYPDLAIGVPFEGLYSSSQVGVVQVVRGSPSGITLQGNHEIDRGTPGIAGSLTAGDRFGYRLATGRFAATALPTLVVSAPRADEAALNAGTVHLIPGSTSGLTATGSQMIHEGVNGVQSAGDNNEQFGYKLLVRQDDQDAHDDLLVSTLYSTDEGQAATHLFYGGSGGITTIGSRYRAGIDHGPRYDIQVEAPQRPSPYIPPSAGEPVSDVATLIARLTDGKPDIIILEDGSYDHSGYVVPNAADQVWAAHAGRAFLNFGFYYQFKHWADHARPELHGLTFDMDTVDYGRVVHIGSGGQEELASIILAGVTSPGTTDANDMSLVVEDCFFYGHGWLDSALTVRRPDEVSVRRVLVRDVHDAGIDIQNPQAFPSSPTVTIEDVDVAGVRKPPNALEPNYPNSPNYFCRSEVGVVASGFETLQLHRARVRDTRCAGINLGVNRYETTMDAGDVSHLDLNCVGFEGPPPGRTDAVRNAALYSQYASYLDISQLHIGPDTYDGMRVEYIDPDAPFGGQPPEHAIGHDIHHALFQSARTGVAWDACSFAMTLSDTVVENAYCAAVVDNDVLPSNECSSPSLLPANSVTAVIFEPADASIPLVFHQNANQCPPPPF